MTNSELRRMIFNEIKLRAPHYAPEWRYSPEHPDAGTALAMLWADMHAETLERFERLPDNYKRALFDALGSNPRPAVAARGFLAFTLREGVSSFMIPKGTVVAAPSDPKEALVTSYHLEASSAKILGIFRVLPQLDSVVRFDTLGEMEIFTPVQGAAHVWTFAHGFALDISLNSTLRLVPDLEDGGLDTLVESPWEYYDGGVWREAAVIRDADALLFIFPEDKENCEAVRVSVKRDTVLSTLTAKPSGYGLFPDALYADSAQAHDGFHLFGQRFIPGMCAYFSCTDALTKPGAKVEMTLTLDFDKFEIEGYSETQIYMKRLMRVSDFKPPEEYKITAAETKWEYFNGVGWAALDTQTDAELFNGKSIGRIKITFDTPADIQSAVIGAHDLPFIRVRLIAADNLYRRRGYYKAPRATDIRFAYRYESGVPLTDIRVAEHLDDCSKTLPARLAPMPDGPAALYFASNAAFTRGTILFHLKSFGDAAGTRWEYFTAGGWSHIEVRDDTEGLAKTGILSYQASKSSEKTRLWGLDAYWLRMNIRDIKQTDVYLYGLYENAVRAVSQTPGESSVMPAGAFSTITAPLSAVESAVNPIVTYGGADAEEESSVITRMSEALSHSGRVVALGDCEELARVASLSVRRVKYYPHTDESGNYAYEQSCLVLMARDEEEFGFDELSGELLAYITQRRAMCAERLNIIPPRYIAVNANMLIESSGETLTIRNRVAEMLDKLLAPSNWEIGKLPAPEQICAEIRAISGVTRLVKFDVSYTIDTGINAGYARAAREPFVLPVSGRHKYTFNGEG